MKAMDIAMLVVALGSIAFAIGIAFASYVWQRQSRARRAVRAPEVVNAPVSPGWSEHDGQTLRAYLESETGRRLLLRLQAAEYAVAVANAKDSMHTSHSAGITVGYGQCIRHVQSLAHCGAAADKVETLPTEEETIADLERRYSP